MTKLNWRVNVSIGVSMRYFNSKYFTGKLPNMYVSSFTSLRDIFSSQDSEIHNLKYKEIKLRN